MFKMWKNKEHEIVLNHMNTNILCKYMIWGIMCPYAFATMGNHVKIDTKWFRGWIYTQQKEAFN